MSFGVSFSRRLGLMKKKGNVVVEEREREGKIESRRKV